MKTVSQGESSFLEKFFKLKQNKTTVRTELIAGFTTFMTMAYILVVNPLVLGEAGMDAGKVFTATAVSAFIGTVVMGLVANLPFALAPGMGLNAFFAYSVVLGMQKSFEFALTAVFLEGIIFILLSFFKVRETIIHSIPDNIKKAISVGIGLFIAFIGLYNAKILVQGPTPLQLGNVTEGPALVALIGIILTSVLLAYKVKGALFIGIIGTTLIGIPLGVTTLPEKWFTLPSSPYWMNFEWSEIFSYDMLTILLTFLFIDIFDTVGTLVGVTTKAGMLENGHVPRARQALLADAIATTSGAMLGTSTVTTYVESAAGVAEGGRTGLTALSASGLFLVALLLSPVFLMIPSAATAPALFLVGLFMLSPIREINFDDFTEAIPAFFTIIMMPLTYSISEGILFGIVSYVLIKIFSGKRKDIPLFTLLLGILFLAKLFFS